MEEKNTQEGFRMKLKIGLVISLMLALLIVGCGRMNEDVSRSNSQPTPTSDEITKQNNLEEAEESDKIPEESQELEVAKAELVEGLVPEISLESLNIDIPDDTQIFKSCLSNFDNDQNEELLMIILQPNKYSGEKFDLALYYIYDTVTQTIDFEDSIEGEDMIFTPYVAIGDLTSDGLPDVVISTPIGGVGIASCNEMVISCINNQFTDIGYPYLNDLDRSIIDNDYAVIYSEPLKTMYKVELTEEEKRITPIEEDSYIFFNELTNAELVSSENGHAFKNKYGLYGILDKFNALAVAEIVHKYDTMLMEWVPVSFTISDNCDRNVSKIDDGLFSDLFVRASFRNFLFMGKLPDTNIGINRSVSDVLNEWGKPDSIDEYDNSLSYYDRDTYIYYFNDCITAIGFGEGAKIFGIKIGMDYDKIISVLGAPDHEYNVADVEMDPIGETDSEIIYNQCGRKFYVSFDSSGNSIGALLK